MAQSLSLARQAEFDSLLAFLRVAVSHHPMFKSLPFDLTDDDNPVILIEQRAVTSPSRALRELRQTVNDLVSDAPLSEQEASELEQRLADAGAPSLRNLQSRNLRKVIDAIERNSITDDAEFYLLRAALADTTQTVLSPELVQVADRLLAEHEASKKFS